MVIALKQGGNSDFRSIFLRLAHVERDLRQSLESFKL